MKLFILVELFENGELIGSEWHLRHKVPNSNPPQYYIKTNNGVLVFIK